MTMNTTRPAIEREVLPPTERAAYQHSLRVHLQVCQWKYLNNHIVDPKEWGWCLQGGFLTPIKTDLDAAPEWLQLQDIIKKHLWNELLHMQKEWVKMCCGMWRLSWQSML